MDKQEKPNQSVWRSSFRWDEYRNSPPPLQNKQFKPNSTDQPQPPTSSESELESESKDQDKSDRSISDFLGVIIVLCLIILPWIFVWKIVNQKDSDQELLVTIVPDRQLSFGNAAVCENNKQLIGRMLYIQYPAQNQYFNVKADFTTPNCSDQALPLIRISYEDYKKLYPKSNDSAITAKVTLH